MLWFCSVSMAAHVVPLRDSVASRQRLWSSSGDEREGSSIFERFDVNAVTPSEAELWAACEGRHASQSGLLRIASARHGDFRCGIAANRYVAALELHLSTHGSRRQYSEVPMSIEEDDDSSVSQEGSVAGNVSAEVEHDAVVYPQSQVNGCLARASLFLRELFAAVGRVFGR